MLKLGQGMSTCHTKILSHYLFHYTNYLFNLRYINFIHNSELFYRSEFRSLCLFRLPK